MQYYSFEKELCYLTRLIVLVLLLFICFTAFVAMERWRQQEKVLSLEKEIQALVLRSEMQAIRKAHPFH